MTIRKRGFANFRRLRIVVDYALDHPECVLPPWTEDRKAHYPSSIVLTDRLIGLNTGVLEARIVHEQDSAYDPRDGYAAIRRLRWDIESDWKRCQKNNVVRPSLSNECFRVDRDGLVKINRVMRAFAKRAGPFEFSELITDQLPEMTGPYRIARKPGHRRRISFGTSGSHVELNFLGNWEDRTLNRAWERVWGVLGSLMTEENSFGPGKFESHGITPNQYARLLAQEANA